LIRLSIYFQDILLAPNKKQTAEAFAHGFEETGKMLNQFQCAKEACDF